MRASLASHAWIRAVVLALGLWAFAVSAAAQTEPEHAAWNRLLAAHVHWSPDGHASTVDYAGMRADRVALRAYLAALPAVRPETFKTWSDKAQLAFLINAYNAWTVELILTGYPGIASIKDLGSLLRSPWQKPFIPLLGQTRSLDDIEHGLIRGSRRYRDPRIHFALNCASIGCPALRPEAYAAERLDAQLEDQMRRFLSDRSRNGVRGEALVVSPIFKWYRGDFEQGFGGWHRLEDFLAGHAADLGLSQAQASALRSGALPVRFGDYDWRLNDGRH